MNREIKIMLNVMMDKKIDSLMEDYNFKRKKGALIYTRTIDKTKQKVDMVFFSRPSYHPGAIAHIYPWLTVYFPEINKIAEEILENVDTSVSSMKVTVRQPIQIGSDSERWMLLDENDKDILAEKIKDFLAVYTLPILDKLKSVDDYIGIYENKDDSIIWDDAFYIFITSAYVLKGEYVKALHVFERRFGKLGPRKKYASAFSYLENLISDIEE